MLTLCKLDCFGQWTGDVREVEESQGWTPEWVLAEQPPEVPEDRVAVWALERWHIRVLVMEAGQGESQGAEG